MKKIVLALILLGLFLVFGSSRAEQETGTVTGGEKNFVLTTFLHSPNISVSFEISADVLDTQNPKNVFLSASFDRSSGFGFTSESIYFNKLQLPDNALRIAEGGKKIILNADLTSIQGFRAFQRLNGQTLYEVSDPSVFPSPTLQFVWQLGDIIPAYGGTIQAFYRRPDGEWSRSTVTSIKRGVEGSGSVFAIPASAFSFRRFEYTENTKDLSISSSGIGFLSLVFPTPPGFPEEP